MRARPFLKRLSAALFPAVLLAACAPVAQRPAAVSPTPPTLERLVASVNIPYDRFVLGNGLVTLVHTDRKAPIVGVTVYYRVGSKHEPRGRTGFAHLYEHLFFGGSANVPDFDTPLEAAGSTPTNGSTWYDRTNYVVTVPTDALELALFMESDRMGYLLPAVTQEKLDRQRSVVQNEKRQGDNQPYGLLEYAQAEGLFPVGHPYRHATIGSMADLEAATLGDVHGWFHDNYGPNNVVLVLSGDIDAVTARPLVEKWFAAIPRGPDVRPVQAAPVTLAAPVSLVMTDAVPVARLTRNWSGPGLDHPDTPALQIGMAILGGLSSSRLDSALVRGAGLAVRVTASASAFEQVATLEATMDVKPGVDPAEAARAFDARIAELVAQGPTEDELLRAVTSTVSAEIGALEQVGGFYGKGATLAEGEMYSGDPAAFRRRLARMAALTPQDVRDALQRWLGRPVLAVDVVPGERTEDGALMGGWGDDGEPPASPAGAERAAAPPSAPAPMRTAPPVGEARAPTWAAMERAVLSNGMEVVLARRTAVPKVTLSLEFPAGFAADASERPGTQGFMLDMLDEGAGGRGAGAIAEEQERLGASLATGGTIDTSAISLTALAANLPASLALMADVARRPDFAPDDVERIRQQRLARLAQAESTPSALASRELVKRLFGDHPYAQPRDGLGTATGLAGITPEALAEAHRRWLRPDRGHIVAVGDVTMAHLLPLLERHFGDWKAPPAPVTPVTSAVPPLPAPARIVLIDRPGSPQSVIVGGKVLPVNGTAPGMESLDLANDVLGGGFLSRLNRDLREEKGWSYGVYSNVSSATGPRVFSVSAPVQADRTGDALRALVDLIAAFPSGQPVTGDELERVTTGNIRSLPTRFETNADVLLALSVNQRLGRPDNYYASLPARWQAIDAGAIESAASRYLGKDGLLFVVVGDQSLVARQLRGIEGYGLEIVPGAPSGG